MDWFFSNSEEEGDEDYSFEWAKKNAFKHYVHTQDDNIFVIEVKSVLKLNMVTNFVSVGVSFWLQNRLYQSVMEETGMGPILSSNYLQCKLILLPLFWLAEDVGAVNDWQSK